MNRDAEMRALGSLLRLEYRRVRKQVLHTLVGSLVVVGGMVVTGVSDVNTTPFVLVAVGFSFLFMGPVHVLKDKLDGTMEFLAGLPAHASILALARCLAASGLAALSAVFLAAACGVALPPMLGSSAARIVVVAYPLSWATASAMSWLLIALLTRFTMTRLASVGLLVPFVVMVGILWLFDWLFGNPAQILLALMDRDSWQWILGSALLLLCAGVMAVSYVVARDGIGRYRPEPDKVEW